MANETELSNISHITDVLSDVMSPAFQDAAVTPALIYAENCPTDTNVKKFTKEGALTAEALSESSAYTFSSSSEYTETAVSATATKGVVVSKLTVEAQRFSSIDMNRIGTAQAKAIARLFDDDVLALFSSLSNQVTATSTLTVPDMFDAQYTIFNAKTPPGQLVALLEYKGANEIKKDIVTSAAPVFSNNIMLDIFDGPPQANGYVGSLPGIDIFQTSGQPTSGGDDVAAVWHPEWCFAAIVDSAIGVRPQWNSTGFWDELSSWLFYDIVEWNDGAGCGLLSDT